MHLFWHVTRSLFLRTIIVFSLLLFYFLSAYGCEVGSSAVKFIPTGGLYVTGGLTPKNIQFIVGQDSPFMKAYHDKGRVKPVLENVPIFAVMKEDLGVRGAYKCAQLVSAMASRLEERY
jgi:glucokinase